MKNKTKCGKENALRPFLTKSKLGISGLIVRRFVKIVFIAC